MDSSLKKSFLSTLAAERICKMMLYQSKCFSELKCLSEKKEKKKRKHNKTPHIYILNLSLQYLSLETQVQRGCKHKFTHCSLKPFTRKHPKSKRIFDFNKSNILSATQEGHRELLIRDSMSY